MADFEAAYAAMIRNEGGFANHPRDNGGMTYKGIARNYHPKWPGWKYVDKVLDGITKQPPYGTNSYKQWVSYVDSAMAGHNLLQDLVRTFYKMEFWPPFANINDDLLASWLFDKGVNMGPGQAAKLVQRAVGVKADGEIGPVSLKAINAADPVDTLEKCKEQARAFYEGLVARDESQRVFLSGWLARV